MTLLELEKRIIEINDKILENTKQHNEFIKTCKAEIARLDEEKSLLLKDLNTDKVKAAKDILYLRLYKVGYENIVRLAINDLVAGGKHMKSEYFGVKDYDRFIGQRCDLPYGYGPKHGNITFAVGLNIRDRELEPYEVECCLYYLNNFFKIHDDLRQERRAR